jgi:tyrosinase
MATSFSQTTAFEFVHNQVHHAVGGFSVPNPGHMATFSYSAFDPILFVIPLSPLIKNSRLFPSFLHHAQTDRLIALWQVMNPTAFMTPDVETEGSYTVAIGENITENTPLGPFFMGDGKTPYTSASSREIKNFGYSYPGLEDVSFFFYCSGYENWEKGTVRGRFDADVESGYRGRRSSLQRM